MKSMIYTNAQLRSILNGLGYTNQEETDDSTFPLSTDDSPLTNRRFVQAIQKFQADHQLEANGTVDSDTASAIQGVIEKLNSQLNRAVNIGFSLDRPVYNAETIFAVKLVQRRLLIDGIASNALREAMVKRQIDAVHPLPYPLQSPAHVFHLGVGDRDW
jgi:peptidoglycan hydrolase-like protein with peptidoglycan-binding domain